MGADIVMNAETKEAVEVRLKRIAGQIAGLQRMVQSDRYCVDVVMQVAAARAALAKVSKVMLASHIETCVASAFNSDDTEDRNEKIEELMRVFDKNCNC